MFAKLWRKIRDAARMISRIPMMIANAITTAIEKMFRTAFGGILEMIENFKRIICFLESMPLRTRNVTSGMANIFLGIEKKVDALGKSFQLGAESTGTLFAYSGEYAGSRLKCVVKFITNFYKCIFFYILKAIGGMLKVIILKPTEYFGSMFGVDTDKLFTKVGNGIIILDTFIYSMVGFHVIYFPESIRKDCFTCVRLKNSAVANRAEELARVFDTKIPNLMTSDGGNKEFNRAKNQFTESSVVVPREPHNVK